MSEQTFNLSRPTRRKFLARAGVASAAVAAAEAKIKSLMQDLAKAECHRAI